MLYKKSMNQLGMSEDFFLAIACILRNFTNTKSSIFLNLIYYNCLPPALKSLLKHGYKIRWHDWLNVASFIALTTLVIPLNTNWLCYPTDRQQQHEAEVCEWNTHPRSFFLSSSRTSAAFIIAVHNRRSASICQHYLH